MLKYKIALCNVFWTYGGIDTKFFENVESQTAYFQNIIQPEWWSDLINFNIGNNIETNIVYRDTSGRSIDDILKCNYCIVKKIAEDNTESYRYFFIDDIRQENSTQVWVKIELDDIQTNYIAYKQLLPKCFIKRAHLDRFLDTGTTFTYRFNNNIDSFLFEKEPIQPREKFLLERQVKKPLNPNATYDDEFIDEYNRGDIGGWCVMFVDSSSFSIPTEMQAEELGNYYYSGQLIDPSIKTDEYSISSGMGIIMFPLSKAGRVNIINYNGKSIDSYSVFQLLKNHNNDFSKVFAYKITLIPPIDNDSNCYVDDNGVMSLTSCTLGPISEDDTSVILGSTYIDNFLPNEAECKYNMLNLPTQEFYIDHIKSHSNDKELNPKLIQSDYIELVIKDISGNEYNFDLLKLGYKKNANDDFTNEIDIKYYESVTPDITRYLVTIDFEKYNGLYKEINVSSLKGLVGSVDNSLPVVNEQLSQFLAENKNYYLQNAIQGSTSVISNLLNGNLLGATTESIDRIANVGFTTDNLKNAPDIVKNANGSVAFNLAYTQNGIAVELRKCLDSELEIANAFMHKNGYTYNRLDYLYNVDNIRKYWNYIECEADCSNLPISNYERQRLEQRLQRVRFWTLDGVVYDAYQNYERRLDNE